MHTGHALVQVFGRRARRRRSSTGQNQHALRGELPRAVPFGHHPAGDPVPGQPELRRHRGHRRLPRRDRDHDAWRRAGVHPVLAPVHDADHADRRPDEPAAVGPRLGRARVRAARRARRRRRTPTRRRELGDATGEVALEHVSFRYDAGQAADRRLQPRGAARADDRHRRADRRGQDDDRQPADALLRHRLRAASGSTASTRASSRARRCARPSAWCCRTRGCSPARSATTSPTGRRAPPRTRSSPPRRRRTSTRSCGRCRTATTRCSTRTRRTSRRASGSCSRSRVPSWRTRASSSSTRRPATSTRGPRS